MSRVVEEGLEYLLVYDTFLPLRISRSEKNVQNSIDDF